MQWYSLYTPLWGLLIRALIPLVLLLIPLRSNSAKQLNDFWTLSTTDGLPNDQTNCIYQDSKGFIWIGTNNGLARYDGFRFKNYYADYENFRTIPSSMVTAIQEDREGNLWLKTGSGYCIFDPTTETANRDITSWMREHSMDGVPYYVYIDQNKNYWIFVYNKGCYFYDTYSGNIKRLQVRTSLEKRLVQGTATSVTEHGGQLFIALNTGMIFTVNASTQQIDWVGYKLNSLFKKYGYDEYKIYVDKNDNLFLFSPNVVKIYDRKAKKWVESFGNWCENNGINLVTKGFTIRDLTEDRRGNLIVGTNNNGLLLIDRKTKNVTHYMYESASSTSLPDNTITDVLIDHQGGIWLATQRNGITFVSAHAPRFLFFPVGDICTITQTANGRFWLGTFDRGIMTFDRSRQILNFANDAITNMESNCVMASLSASDGTLWFGTYGGGLVGVKGGEKKVYIAHKGQLSNNNVLSLAEDHQHRIIVGTHGGGVQILNPKSGKISYVNSHNSKLRSDLISSVFTMHDGRILIGHALGFSILDPNSGKVINGMALRQNSPLSSSSVSQAIEDSRGLIWIATMSGLDVYNPKKHTLQHVFNEPKVAASLVEDKQHCIWAAVEHGMVRVRVQLNNGKLSFFTSYYDNLDGLQNRQLNFRSIFLDNQGNVAAGGPDGINLISPANATNTVNQSKALFCGLVLFNQIVNVEQEYNGKVLLQQSLEASHRLTLSHSDNNFTILLASDHIEIPQRARFEYRIKGLNDQWLVTAEDNPSVSFTNLSPGHYTLEVRVINRDGSVSAQISKLEIIIRQPFWRSPIALLIYLVLIALGCWFAYRIVRARRYKKLKEAQKALQEAQQQEINEMKLRFFTNISHEIRTPLALIVSPLKRLLGQETNPQKKDTLTLILRNAVRLLNIVNQTLEVRKLEKTPERLNLITGDIMKLTCAMGKSFAMADRKNIQYHYHCEPDSLLMSFDQDKFDKIVMNLLSNAFKFVPDNGVVELDARLVGKSSDEKTHEGQWFQLTVSNSGKGISDDEKKHIFDRYYQAVSNNAALSTGTGIGLSIVQQYAQLHGGNVELRDRDGGGCTFIVKLPYRYDPTLPPPEDFEKIKEPIDYYENVNGEDKPADNGMNIALRNSDGSVRYEVLVVDDSSDFRGFMAEQLSENFRVRTAANGKEALRMIEEKLPDIVLSDVMMPEMDGNELCRRVKQNPKTAHLPFIMLTARLSSEYKMEGLSSGADDYITKPFDFDMLYLRMNNLIKWHKAVPDENEHVEHDRQQTNELSPVDKKLLETASKYVEDNLANSDLSVESMSAALSMSRVHLYKKLLSITGSTPSEFIRTIRLKHAAELLKEGELNVSEVAYRVGFNSPRYFSRYFKDYFGVMPSQYKKADNGVVSPDEDNE